MISKIELKLIDDKGNYSVAHIDYKGCVDMQTKHGVNMVTDVLNHMVLEYLNKGKMEIDVRKHPCVSHDDASWEQEMNERMDIIGQNGNEGLHYVSNEEADEDAIGKHIQFRSPHKH